VHGWAMFILGFAVGFIVGVVAFVAMIKFGLRNVGWPHGARR